MAQAEITFAVAVAWWLVPFLHLLRGAAWLHLLPPHHLNLIAAQAAQRGVRVRLSTGRKRHA